MFFSVSHGVDDALGAGDSTVTRQSPYPRETWTAWEEVVDKHESNLEGTATQVSNKESVHVLRPSLMAQ